MDKKIGIALAIVFLIIILLGTLFYLNSNNRNGEEASEAKSSPTVSMEAPEMMTDVDLIEEALVLKNDWRPGENEVTITENDGKYATGMAGPAGGGPGGGIWFAALVNGEWEIVWDGNGTVMCEELTDYPDFPTDLIPQCYDSATEEMIER